MNRHSSLFMFCIFAVRIQITPDPQRFLAYRKRRLNENRSPVLQQVWHGKVPFLFKGHNICLNCSAFHQQRERLHEKDSRAGRKTFLFSNVGDWVSNCSGINTAKLTNFVTLGESHPLTVTRKMIDKSSATRVCLNQSFSKTAT